MLEVVEVTEVNDDTATVFLERSSACGGCGKCMIGRKNLEVTAHVKNTLGAKVGDKVTVEMELSGVLSAGLIAYGFPLVAFIAGCLLGYYFLAALIGMDENLVAFLSGLIFIGISYLIIKVADRKGAFKERYDLTMKGIVPEK